MESLNYLIDINTEANKSKVKYSNIVNLYPPFPKYQNVVYNVNPPPPEI